MNYHTYLPQPKHYKLWTSAHLKISIKTNLLKIYVLINSLKILLESPIGIDASINYFSD
jgi:hypothetical protein